MKIKKIIIGIIVLLIIILGASSIVVTYNNEFKLIRRFAKVDRVVTTSGISFKIPFLENVDTIPKNTLLYDMSSSDVITMDKKTMVTDTYVLWKIEDPLKFAQSLNSSIVGAEDRLNNVVYNALKNNIGSLSQAEVISARDGELSQKIMESVATTMAQYGIILVSVETKHLDLPSDNKTAVYERMISERDKIAVSYTAEGASESQIIKNTTDREIAVMLSEAEATAASLVADGEAEYMKILSQSYSDQSRSSFYSFVRALDSAKASLTGDNKTLILSSDSPIAQIFLGY